MEHEGGGTMPFIETGLISIIFILILLAVYFVVRGIISTDDAETSKSYKFAKYFWIPALALLCVVANLDSQPKAKAKVAQTNATEITSKPSATANSEPNGVQAPSSPESVLEAIALQAGEFALHCPIGDGVYAIKSRRIVDAITEYAKPLEMNNLFGSDLAIFTSNNSDDNICIKTSKASEDTKEYKAAEYEFGMPPYRSVYYNIGWRSALGCGTAVTVTVDRTSLRYKVNRNGYMGPVISTQQGQCEFISFKAAKNHLKYSIDSLKIIEDQRASTHRQELDDAARRRKI